MLHGDHLTYSVTVAAENHIAHTNKMRYREYLKEVLGRFDAAQVYAELSGYGDKHTAKYKCELETAHPELKGPVRAVAETGKYKPRSKPELIELLDMGLQMPLDKINTSCITDMEGLFQNSKSRDFTGIETWDTSNVVTMKNMFAGAEYFDHDISRWDVSNVRDMSHMFDGARRFNQPLNDWIVSNVRNMSKMFCKASSFNQPLDRWNVSKVKDMTCMFYGATSFRQPITAWKLSSQSTRGIFLDLPDYRDMESRVMCLATLDGNNREYELQEMIEILGEKEVQDALRIHGAKYGLKEYLQNNGE